GVEQDPAEAEIVDGPELAHFGLRDLLEELDGAVRILRVGIDGVAAADSQRLAIVAGALVHLGIGHDAELEAGRLAAALGRREGALRIPSALREYQRATVVEVRI